MPSSNHITYLTFCAEIKVRHILKHNHVLYKQNLLYLISLLIQFIFKCSLKINFIYKWFLLQEKENKKIFKQISAFGKIFFSSHIIYLFPFFAFLILNLCLYLSLSSFFSSIPICFYCPVLWTICSCYIKYQETNIKIV